jgi:hypothetical protein
MQAEWPAGNKIPAVVLSVWIVGSGVVDRNIQTSIESGSVAFLRAKLAEVAPNIEVLSRPEVTQQEYHATAAWAGYDIWLTQWHDSVSNRDVILGAAILRIAVRGTMRTDFVPALFQSAPDQQSIAAAIEKAVHAHMMDAIVSPIGRSNPQ